MIESITVKGNKVIITARCKYPVKDYAPDFNFECPGEFYAKLMADNLQNNFSQTLEKIRKIEYEAGWSDAKKKKKKRDYFYNSMTTKEY